MSSPFATPSKLDSALRAGQTGCLESGTYGSTSTEYVFSSNGTAGSPVTITAAPGASATIDGFVVINGTYTTVSGLTIDGSNTFYSGNPGDGCAVTNGSEALEINGTGDTFENNNYYQRSEEHTSELQSP